MNIRKIFLASAFFLCFCKAGFSENPDTASYKYRYSLWGAGFKQQKISFLTPLFYEGVSFAAPAIGKASFRNRKLTTSFYDQYYDFFPNRHNEDFIFSMGGEHLYNKYYLLPKRAGSKASASFFVGWGWWFDYMLALKTNNTNNSLYYHFNNMGCLTFAATGRIKSVHILNELAIPLLGVYLGSQYGSPLPYFASEEDANFFDDFDLLFINKNLQLKNRLSVDFKLFRRSSTTMRVQYELSARSLRLNNNELINICHIFKIGYLLDRYAHK
jgi:hypothetical protein